jgi:hypothetical protein
VKLVPVPTAIVWEAQVDLVSSRALSLCVDGAAPQLSEV